MSTKSTPIEAKLVLPTLSGSLIRVPVVPSTPEILYELMQIRSPFVVGGVADRHSAFRVLWRHHPLHMRPSGFLPNKGRHASFLERIRSEIARALLSVSAGRLAWPSAEVCIYAWLAEDVAPAVSKLNPQ